MSNLEYYKINISLIGNIDIWMLEIEKGRIIREIGLNKEEIVLFKFPNNDYPRGFFGDSLVYFEQTDLIEISEAEFMEKWK